MLNDKILDGDGFVILAIPRSFRDFKIANRVEYITTEEEVDYYTYKHVELPREGRIKVCNINMTVIAIKEDEL